MTLINNVSSHAITTLNPEEMLAKIAAEIENALAYDHIGIAILDYSSKELVIQAEAGARRDALGRRILLGEGLVGQVARIGPNGGGGEVNAASPASGACRNGFGDRAAGDLCASNLLGVLYVESAESMRVFRRRKCGCCGRWRICSPGRCTTR